MGSPVADSDAKRAIPDAGGGEIDVDFADGRIDRRTDRKLEPGSGSNKSGDRQDDRLVQLQAAKWSGVQAASFSAAGAERVEATQLASLSGQQALNDVVTVTSWLVVER